MSILWWSFSAWKPSPPSEEAWEQLRDDETAYRVGNRICTEFFAAGFRETLWMLIAGGVGVGIALLEVNAFITLIGFGLSFALLGWLLSLISLVRATVFTRIKWWHIRRAADRARSYQEFLRLALHSDCLDISRFKPHLDAFVVASGGEIGIATEEQFVQVVRSHPHLQQNWPRDIRSAFRY